MRPGFLPVLTDAPRRASILERWRAWPPAERRRPVPETADDIVDVAEESKKYEDEWVLFEVTEVDERNEPVRGRLLCHSRSRDEIHDVAMKYRGSGLGLDITFTGDPVPPDMIAVL